jgi:hypothetical protein
VARISDAFGVDVPLRQLFESPTIAALAKKIQQIVQENEQGGGKADAVVPIKRVVRQAVLLPR